MKLVHGGGTAARLRCTHVWSPGARTVWWTHPRGQTLDTGLRPAEARNLRLMDCSVPEDGWGTLLLSTSFQSLGPGWTDGGRTGEERQLKHRDRGDTRPVPAAPNW